MRVIYYILALAGLSTVAQAQQHFDVLLYRDVPNPNNVPTNWPARVEISTDRPAPWIKVTREQLEVYRETHRAAYENWEATREQAKRAAETTERTRREQLIAQAIADFDLALENWAGLSAAQQKAVLQRCVQILRAMLREELSP